MKSVKLKRGYEPKPIELSRGISFALITPIYLLTAAVAMLIYGMLPYNMVFSLLFADMAATVLIFAFGALFSNASVYDPYWSFAPIVILLSFVIGTDVVLTAEKLLLLIAVLIWGVRLTANWAYTFRGTGFVDWRYRMLRRNTGALYPLVNFLGIHMFPTLVVFFAILPAVYVIENDEAPKSALYIIFFVTAILSVVLQGVSDCQMHKYRKNRKEPFIRVGLWRYSRHPNYLGEILMWWSVGFYSIAVIGFEWYSLIGAVINTVLFLAVSIPMADSRQAKKEGFEEYKRQTRMLLPIKRFKCREDQ
jgi:steroid 5-alpha reductase family enzyme